MTSEPPCIRFPCPGYPIKVIADSHETLAAEVAEIVGQHDVEFQVSTIELVPSRNGNYTSVRLAILATGEVQLSALHQQLMNHRLVRMVL